MSSIVVLTPTRRPASNVGPVSFDSPGLSVAPIGFNFFLTDGTGAVIPLNTVLVPAVAGLKPVLLDVVISAAATFTDAAIVGASSAMVRLFTQNAVPITLPAAPSRGFIGIGSTGGSLSLVGNFVGSGPLGGYLSVTGRYGYVPGGLFDSVPP